MPIGQNCTKNILEQTSSTIKFAHQELKVALKALLKTQKITQSIQMENFTTQFSALNMEPQAVPNLPAPIASVMLWLYISDFSSSSSASAPLISALDGELGTAYR